MPTWGPLGKQTTGKDFNYYREVAVAITDGYFPEEPQIMTEFRGPRRMLFVCPSGEVEYSFNGNTLHGKVVSGEPSEKLNFDVRNEDKIWLRGTGTIQVHIWHIGV